MSALGLLFEDGSCVETVQQVFEIGGAALVCIGFFGFEPFVRNQAQDCFETFESKSFAGQLACLVDGTRPLQQNVVPDLGEGRHGFRRCGLPVMVEEESCAVVDKVKLAVLDEQVGVARGAIDVLSECVEPNSHRGDLGRGDIASGSVEHKGAGEIVEGEIQAAALTEKMADFGVGLVTAEGGIDFGEDKFRNGEAEKAADFSCHEFCNQSERALSGPAKFEDVEAQVVGFNNSRQGAALAQGKDVTCCVYGSQHLCQCRATYCNESALTPDPKNNFDGLKCRFKLLTREP
jgi:hypothetical protein